VAGARALPVVFVIVNNGWAISVPVAAQTAAQTLAQKAVAAGIPGVQVDGNDVFAVRAVVGEALEAARRGGGPALIEALTYRLSDHTTADDASRYRPAEGSQRGLDDSNRCCGAPSICSRAGAWNEARSRRCTRNARGKSMRR
jgi:2-oxoisovalerate dehydrogenase E1 component alpha subunit